jgi:RimJ/RimL family protein N-acetyltransferase
MQTKAMAGPRIKLRQWTDHDIEPFAAMNADPKVMELFPQKLTMEQSLASFTKLRSGIAERGWGLWVVEVGGDFAGFTGLAEPGFVAPFTPCTEIAWRFRPKFWGQGYGIEAARVALRFAFQDLGLQEIVSFTAVPNLRSQRLMQRLGMTHSPRESFEHPMIPVGHPIRPHVLYRIRNSPVEIEKLNQMLAGPQNTEAGR